LVLVFFLSSRIRHTRFSRDWSSDVCSSDLFDPQFGARPLKRLIQKQIINQLSKKLLEGSIDKSKPVLVDVFDGVVVFRNEMITEIGRASCRERSYDAVSDVSVREGCMERRR